MAVQIADPAHLGGGHLDPRLLLAETLHALPPALIFTAEFDPLRDEAKQYAARLE
jgi:acetyl esterase